MRKAGVAHSKSSKDMESHVFLKAKTRVRPGGGGAAGAGARPRGGCSLLGAALQAVPCVCGATVGGQCVGAQAGLLAPLFVPSPRESCRVLLGLGGSWGQCPRAETLCPRAQSSPGSGPGSWFQEGSCPLLSDAGDACGGCGPGKDGGRWIKQLGRVLCEFSQELGLPGPHVTPPVIVRTWGQSCSLQ